MEEEEEVMEHGGVESFEDGEENNPPSVMVNPRAAVVAGEPIPGFLGLGIVLASCPLGHGWSEDCFLY